MTATLGVAEMQTRLNATQALSDMKAFEDRMLALLTRLEAKSSITVRVNTAPAMAALTALTAARTVQINANLNLGSIAAQLATLTASRSLTLNATLNLGSTAAQLATLGAGRTVNIPVHLDTTSVPAQLAALEAQIRATATTISSILTVNTSGLTALNSILTAQVAQLTALVTQLQALRSSGAGGAGGGGVRTAQSAELKALKGDYDSAAISAARYKASLEALLASTRAEISSLEALSSRTAQQKAQLDALRATAGQVSNALKSLASDGVSKLRADLAAARAQFDAASAAATNMTQRRAAIQAYTAEVTRLQGEIRTMAGQTGLASTQVTALNNLLARTHRELNTINGGVNIAGLSGNILNAVNAASLLIPGLGTINSLLATMGGLSAGLMPLLAVILAIGAGAVVAGQGVSKFKEFEKFLAYTATLSEEAKARIGEFKQEIYDLAPASGVGPAKLAEGLNLIAQSSNDANKWMGTLNASAKATFATGAQMKTVVDGVTTALNVGLATSADVVVDKLFQIVNLGKISFEEVSGQMGKVASLATNLGVKFDELGAVVATATSKGVRAETTFAGLNQLLVNSLKPTEAATEYAKQYGVELGETAIKGKGFTGFLLDVIEKTGGSSEALSKIFTDIDSLKVLMPIAADGGQKYIQMLKGMENSTGMTDRAVELMSRTLEGSQSIFKSTADTALTQIGEQLAPVVRDTFNLGTVLILSFIRVLSGLGNVLIGVKDVGWATFKALGAVIGTVLGATSVAVEAWGRGIGDTFRLLGQAKDQAFAGDFDGVKATLGKLRDVSVSHVQDMKAAIGTIPKTLEGQFVQISDTAVQGLNRIQKGYSQLTTASKSETDAATRLIQQWGKAALEGENAFKLGQSGSANSATNLDTEALARVKRLQAEEAARKKTSEALKAQRDALGDLKLKYDAGILSQAQYETALKGVLSKYTPLLKSTKEGTEAWRTYGEIVRSAKGELESLARTAEQTAKRTATAQKKAREEALKQVAGSFQIRTDKLLSGNAQGFLEPEEFTAGANKLRQELQDALKVIPETSPYAKSMRKMLSSLTAEAQKMNDELLKAFQQQQTERFKMSPSLITYSYGQGTSGLASAIKGLTGKDFSKDLLAGMQELQRIAPETARVVSEAYASVLQGLRDAQEQGPRIAAQAVENTVEATRQAYDQATSDARGNAAALLEIEQTLGADLLAAAKRNVEGQYQQEKQALDTRYAEMALHTLDLKALQDQYAIDLRAITLKRDGEIAGLERAHQQAILTQQNAALALQGQLEQQAAQTQLTRAQSNYDQQLAQAGESKQALLDVERQYGTQLTGALKAAEQARFNTERAALQRDLEQKVIGQETFNTRLAALVASRDAEIARLDREATNRLKVAQDALQAYQLDQAEQLAASLLQVQVASAQERIRADETALQTTLSKADLTAEQRLRALQGEGAKLLTARKNLLSLQEKQEVDAENARYASQVRQANREGASQSALQQMEDVHQGTLQNIRSRYQNDGVQAERQYQQDLVEAFREAAIQKKELILKDQELEDGVARGAAIGALRELAGSFEKLGPDGAGALGVISDALDTLTGKTRDAAAEFRRLFDSQVQKGASPALLDQASLGRDLNKIGAPDSAEGAFDKAFAEYDSLLEKLDGRKKAAQDAFKKITAPAENASSEEKAAYQQAKQDLDMLVGLLDTFRATVVTKATAAGNAASAAFQQAQADQAQSGATALAKLRRELGQVDGPALLTALKAEQDYWQKRVDVLSTGGDTTSTAYREALQKLIAARKDFDAELASQQDTADQKQTGATALASAQRSLGLIDQDAYSAALRAERDYWQGRVDALKKGGDEASKEYRAALDKLAGAQKAYDAELTGQQNSKDQLASLKTNLAQSQRDLGVIDQATYMAALRAEEAYWQKRVEVLEAGGEASLAALQDASGKLLAARNKIRSEEDQQAQLDADLQAAQARFDQARGVEQEPYAAEIAGLEKMAKVKGANVEAINKLIQAYRDLGVQQEDDKQEKAEIAALEQLEAARERLRIAQGGLKDEYVDEIAALETLKEAQGADVEAINKLIQAYRDLGVQKRQASEFDQKQAGLKGQIDLASSTGDQGAAAAARAQYRANLEAQLSVVKEFSPEWLALKKELTDLNLTATVTVAGVELGISKLELLKTGLNGVASIIQQTFTDLASGSATSAQDVAKNAAKMALGVVKSVAVSVAAYQVQAIALALLSGASFNFVGAGLAAGAAVAIAGLAAGLESRLGAQNSTVSTPSTVGAGANNPNAPTRIDVPSSNISVMASPEFLGRLEVSTTRLAAVIERLDQTVARLATEGVKVSNENRLEVVSDNPNLAFGLRAL